MEIKSKQTLHNLSHGIFVDIKIGHTVVCRTEDMSTRYSSIYTSLFLLDSTVQLASTLVSTHITWPHLALFHPYEATFERGRSSTITRSVSSNGNFTKQPIVLEFARQTWQCLG